MTEGRSAPCSAERVPWWRELARILLRRRWLMLALICLSILGPALEPAQGWAAKSVLDRITQKNRVLARSDLIVFLPGVLAALHMVSHVLDKVLDARIKIDLQRSYLERQFLRLPGEDVPKTIYDCEQARKIVDIVQRDMWVVLIGLPAVLVWQLRLAPEWVIPLALASVPPLCITLFLGPAVSRWSRRRLEAVTAISGAVCENDRARLLQSQALFYRSSVWFEVCKKSTDVAGQLALWLGLAVLLAASRFVPVLPDEVTAGDLALFVVNLKLIGKPFQELGRLYVKIHESYPAVIRVLGPGRERVTFLKQE